jgi:S-adenosylmethionine/arginine decarboxylase-like enzyme
MNGYLFWSNTKVKNPEKLLNKKYWSKFFDELIRRLLLVKAKDLIPDKKIKDRLFVLFPGGGWTGFQAIGESAITIHTFHEEQSFRLEISSCKWIDKLKVIEVIEKFFEVKQLNYGLFDWKYGRIVE